MILDFRILSRGMAYTYEYFTYYQEEIHALLVRTYTRSMMIIIDSRLFFSNVNQSDGHHYSFSLFSPDPYEEAAVPRVHIAASLDRVQGASSRGRGITIYQCQLDVHS